MPGGRVPASPLQPLNPHCPSTPPLSPPGRNSPQRAGSHSSSPRAQLPGGRRGPASGQQEVPSLPLPQPPPQLPRCSVLGAHRGPGLKELEAALGARQVPQPWRSESGPQLGAFGSQKSPLIQRGHGQRMALSPFPQNCPVSPAAAPDAQQGCVWPRARPVPAWGTLVALPTGGGEGVGAA